MKNIKDLVLTAIEEKLLTNSFRSVSIDSIAKELHISKRTIYETFESKESIFEMAVDRYQQKIINYANTVAAKIQSGEISFTDGMYDLIKYFSERTMFNNELLALLPEKTKKIDQKKKKIFMKFYKLAVQEGIIRKEINKEVYFMIVRCCALAMRDSNLRQDCNFTNMNSIISDFMNIINLGILTDKGKKIYCKHNYK